MMKQYSLLTFGVSTALLTIGCGTDDSGDVAAGTAGTTTTGGTVATSTPMLDGGTATDGGGGQTGDTTAAAGNSSSEGGGSGSSSGGDAASTTDGGGSSSSGGGSSSDGMQIENCEAPGELISCDALGTDPQWWESIGLGCEGGVNEVIPIVSSGFNSQDGTAWAIATQFGTYEEMPGVPLWRPSEGEQMLMLSSGQGGVPDAAGLVTFQTLDLDDNGNPDNKPLPAPMSPQPGSGGAPFTGCDEVNDCSDSLITQWNAGGGGANDLIWFQFAVDVPAGTHGFSFDFAYFSEEFPEWVGTTFNDMFVVWSNSETYTGNLCFVDDQPCTVTALWPTTYQPGATELADTGFENDAATGWFQIKGSAEPGELLQLTLSVFDMGDTAFDTMILLDRFAWDCEGCVPTEIMSCGVVDPV